MPKRASKLLLGRLGQRAVAEVESRNELWYLPPVALVFPGEDLPQQPFLGVKLQLGERECCDKHEYPSSEPVA